MLRDRLVCGVNHEGIQRKLLSERNLTYDKAFELSVAIETAERDTKDLKTQQPRDRLVCEVNHEGIQRKLLSKRNLTYDKAFELSVSIKTAEQDTKDLKTR